MPARKGKWVKCLTPKDIFRSRWKRFYKRCHRFRTAGVNTLDASLSTPPKYDHDSVPSPWRLHYSPLNYNGDYSGYPLDQKLSGAYLYAKSFKKYMSPADQCNNDAARDAIMRCLDAGRRGGAESGLGRPVVFVGISEEPSVPGTEHLHEIIKGFIEESKQDQNEAFKKALRTESDVFAVRRLYEVCDEWETVWEKAANNTDDENSDDEGRFPYVNEDATLVGQVRMNDILRVRHRTNWSSKPYWVEYRYQKKKRKQKYLRLRHVKKEEEKRAANIVQNMMEDDE